MMLRIMNMIKKRRMSEEKKHLESGTLKGKMKELTSISFFTLIAAFLALFLADIVFFPLAYYSVRNVDIFNILFKYSGIIFIVSLLFVLLLLKIRSLYRDGKTPLSILIYVFIRPFQYAGFMAFMFTLIALIILVIYFIFSSNYYHLHRIAGGA